MLTVDDTVASEWGPRIVDFLAQVAAEVREARGPTVTFAEQRVAATDARLRSGSAAPRARSARAGCPSCGPRVRWRSCSSPRSCRIDRRPVSDRRGGDRPGRAVARAAARRPFAADRAAERDRVAGASAAGGARVAGGRRARRRRIGLPGDVPQPARRPVPARRLGGRGCRGDDRARLLPRGRRNRAAPARGVCRRSGRRRARLSAWQLGRARGRGRRVDPGRCHRRCVHDRRSKRFCSSASLRRFSRSMPGSSAVYRERPGTRWLWRRRGSRSVPPCSSRTGVSSTCSVSATRRRPASVSMSAAPAC